MATKLALTQTFAAVVKVQIPDPEKPNVFRTYEFGPRFKLQDNTPERRDELLRIQDEKGQYGLLNEILSTVPTYPKDVEFVDNDDVPLSVDEWCKRHSIVGSEFIAAFWQVVNKGIEEKNLRKSRPR